MNLWEGCTSFLPGDHSERKLAMLQRDRRDQQNHRDFFPNSLSSLNDALAKSTYATVFPSAYLTATGQSGNEGDQQQPDQARRWLPLRTRIEAAGDRFIPRRSGVDIEVSHYYHTRAEDNEEKDRHYLDVFNGIKNATERWRRRYMDNAFQYLNLFNGLQNKRVLNIVQSPSALELRKALKAREFNEDSQWECRPRKQPLMNMKGETSKRYRDHGAQIFRFAMPIKYPHLIDWSSTNILAAALLDTMCICDVDFKHLSKVYRVEYTSYLCCVKWNNKGTQVALSGVEGSTSLYDTDLSVVSWTEKWTKKRLCDSPGSCRVISTNWDKNDQHIILACSSGTLIILKATTAEVTYEMTFEALIIEVSLSPNDQYLIVSGSDKLVKVFDYATMAQIFEIEFYACVKAMAWHPWKSGILCIGGGPGDGSLSLWNVNNQRQLGFRNITFVGSVDYMMFNKLSGELLVHWYYMENDRLRSKIVVLAGLDKVVDNVPIQPEHRMLNILWSPDHTKLAMQHRETLVIWNFFGNDVHKWKSAKKKPVAKEPINHLRNYCLDMRSSTGPHTALASAKRGGRSFHYYNIR